MTQTLTHDSERNQLVNFKLNAIMTQQSKSTLKNENKNTRATGFKTYSAKFFYYYFIRLVRDYWIHFVNNHREYIVHRINDSP